MPETMTSVEKLDIAEKAEEGRISTNILYAIYPHPTLYPF